MKKTGIILTLFLLAGIGSVLLPVRPTLVKDANEDPIVTFQPEATPTPDIYEQELEVSNVTKENTSARPVQVVSTPVPAQVIVVQSDPTVSCTLKTGIYQLPASYCAQYQSIDANTPQGQAYTPPPMPTFAPFVPGQPQVQDLSKLIEKPLQIVPQPTKDPCVHASTGEEIGGTCSGSGGGL